MMDPRSVLFVSDGSEWSRHAHDYLTSRFATVDWYPWDHGLPHTRSFVDWKGVDVLLAFKADFILPVSMLNSVREQAINFHPSIPDYRGIGGYRYALDDKINAFGATCHYITPDLDAGAIIKVSRFSIHANETEESLAARTAAVALAQLYGVVDDLLANRELPRSDGGWGTRLYTRAMLARYRAARDGELAAV